MNYSMDKKYKYLIVVLLIVVSFIAFGRILGNDFTNYDDGAFITENNHIKAGFNAESIKWALTTTYVSGYLHPPVWLSYMLDWSLFGANAGGHHLVSLLWHIGSAILLFLFLSKTTGALLPSAFVAALFALHPLRVESVAWASERRDVLSVFFGMATLYVYAYYVENPQISKYFLCLVLFVLALMSKPMLVTLPFVMLLLDYWPLGRLQKVLTPQRVTTLVDNGAGKKKSKQRKAESFVDKKIAKSVQSNRQLIINLLWEKVPFFFLALALGIIVIWQVQEAKLFVSLQHIPFSDRIMNAMVSYVAYLGKTFWPINLAVFYPYEHSLPLWQVLGASLILLGISASVIYQAKRAPFLVVGWFWYLGVLFPVIGLMQASTQAMADRYTYFPSIGIAIMVTWGVVYLLPKENLRKIIVIPAAIIFAALTFLTWQQCGYWKNSISLFNHVLQVTKDNDLAHINLGSALAAQGKNEEAIAHYLEAIKIKPYISLAHFNLGVALTAQGKNEEAIASYREAIRLDPYSDKGHANLGVALADQGNNAEAIVHYLVAIKSNPNDYETHYNLAIALGEQGKVEEAIALYREALRINPDYSSAHVNLGVILGKQLKHDEALYHFRQALKTDPNVPGIYFSLGVALANTGRLKEAEENFRHAVYLKPDYEDAHRGLSLVLDMERKQNAD
jgi:tetratricopeptide (TPR) repeat protein